MTVLDDCRNTLRSTNGKNNIEKFVFLADKFYEQIRTNEQKDYFILIILSKLEDNAYEVAINCRPQNWTVVKTNLLKAFVEIKPLNILHIELSNCCQKQNETILDFSLRLKTIINNLRSAYKKCDQNFRYYDSDKPALLAFEDGLVDPFIRILVITKATSLEQAIDIAIREETLQKKKNENILQNKEIENVNPQWRKNKNIILKTKTNIRFKPYDLRAEKSLKSKTELIKIFKRKKINMLANEVGSLRNCSRNNNENPLVLNKKNIINSELFSVKSKLIKEKNIVEYPKLNSASDAQILNPIEEKILIIPRGKKKEEFEPNLLENLKEVINIEVKYGKPIIKTEKSIGKKKRKNKNCKNKEQINDSTSILCSKNKNENLCEDLCVIEKNSEIIPKIYNDYNYKKKGSELNNKRNSANEAPKNTENFKSLKETGNEENILKGRSAESKYPYETNKGSDLNTLIVKNKYCKNKLSEEKQIPKHLKIKAIFNIVTEKYYLAHMISNLAKILYHISRPPEFNLIVYEVKIQILC
jgi:hypothetical protein